MKHKHKRHKKRHAKVIRKNLRISVAGVNINCGPHQADERVILDIKSDRNGIMDTAGDYLVASIVIPPAEYVESGSGDKIVRKRRKLNHNRIRVRLFELARTGATK